MATTVQRKVKKPPIRSSYTFSQLESLYIANGGSKLFVFVMVVIALAESSGNPRATHTNTDGSIDRGLWQINTSNNAAVMGVQGQNIFDPNVNAKAAIYLAEHSGNHLSNWTTFTSGAWEKHLPPGTKVSGIPWGALPHGTSVVDKAGSVASAVTHPGRTAQKAVNAAVDPIAGAIESGVTTVGREVMFALIILGGGSLFLLGLTLIAADLGLAAFAAVKQGKTAQRYGGLTNLPRQRRERKVASTRAAELHGHRVRLGEARVKTEQARATEIRSKSRARSKAARLTKAEQSKREEQAYSRGVSEGIIEMQSRRKAR